MMGISVLRSVTMLCSASIRGAQSPSSKLEYRCVIAEAFLSQLFHELDRHGRDAVLPGVFFDAFLDHGAQEVGNPAQPQRGGIVPLHCGCFLDIECDLDLLSALWRVETPL